MTAQIIETMEALPEWAKVIAGFGIIGVMLWLLLRKNHRTEVVTDRSWIETVQKQFRSELAAAITEERNRSKDALAVEQSRAKAELSIEASRCDQRIELLEATWQAKADGHAATLTLVKDRQAELLGQLSRLDALERFLDWLIPEAVAAGVPRDAIGQRWPPPPGSRASAHVDPPTRSTS